MSSTTGLNTQIVPDSVESRLVILYVMVIGAIFLPASLAELLDLASRKSKYSHRYRVKRGQSHVIVMGNFDATILRDFLREFFSLDHGTETMTTVVVLLNSAEPGPDIVAILEDPIYLRRVQYIKGQETSFHSLKKAVFNESSGCFILAKKLNDLGRDPRIIDAECIMRVLSLRKFSSEIPLFVSVSLPTNRIHFQYLADHAICLEELKMGMLAQNCLAPGFSTLIIHLTISLTEENIRRHLDSSGGDTWMAGYAHSVSQEIYPVSLTLYKGLLFAEAVIRIYQQQGALLFALCDATGEVLINPSKYIQGNECGYVITRDAEVAKNIASGLVDVSRASRLHEPPQNLDTSDEGPMLRDELVYKGRKGKGAVHDQALLKMSPPLQPSSKLALKINTIDTFPPINLQDPAHFENHVIMCHLGASVFPKTLVCFIEPFRKQNSELPIVILTSVPPDESDLALLALYPKTYFITGSGYERKDLEKCGVAQCAIAIVTGNNRQDVGRSVDSSTLLVVLNIEALSVKHGLSFCLMSDVLILMDLAHTENIKFIGQERGNNKRPSGSDLFSQLLNPSFASGKVFSQSLLNSLIASAYYNPCLLKIIHKLVFPSRTRIQHLQVGSQYRGMAWTIVFEVFLKIGVPLGLYRYRAEAGYYVIVNPGALMKVGARDFVICLINM